MADLNDFFARKDRNKPKSTKFTTLNNIGEKLKEMDLKREKARLHSSDDEWKLFEERKIDYSGLKIQNSILQEDDTESDKDGEEPSCPWSTKTQNQDPAVAEDDTTREKTRAWKTAEAHVKQEKPAPTARVYVPPHLRNKPAATSTVRSNQFKGLQDENGEDMFPSLPPTGSASVWENNTKMQQSHFATNKDLSLENRFGTLNNFVEEDLHR